MRARVRQFLHGLFSSYWFIPATMSAMAILLSFTSTLLDGWLGSDWMHDINWLWSNKPEGARAVLSTLAGSMITVAGVTFSVTISAVAFTSSQIAPRLLTNFMEDRGNQWTLGTFVSTFLYCLLVLRTVRSGGDGPGAEQLAFVPHVSVLIATVLAVASVGMLIYFMHHVPESIHISNVIASIGNELLGRIEPASSGRKSTSPEGASAQSETDLPEGFGQRAAIVAARTSGYIQNLDPSDLIDVASKHDLVVEVLALPGDHVMWGQPLLLAFPPENVDDSAAASLRRSFACGDRRTPSQDSMFLVNELAEIAARALSPGVNDPFTAISCLHWLKQAVAKVAQHDPPASRRHDADSVLRLVMHPAKFRDFAKAAFEQLRPYVANDRNAALVYLRCLKDLVAIVEQEEHRVVLAELGTALYEETDALSPRDRCELEDSLHELRRLKEASEARQAYLRQKTVPDGGG